jgi:hypothetical protein
MGMSLIYVTKSCMFSIMPSFGRLSILRMEAGDNGTMTFFIISKRSRTPAELRDYYGAHD